MRVKSKKTIEREMNEIWKNKVRERDDYTCQVCLKKLISKHCHSHHIIPRQIKGLKWDINNGISLCFVHHKVGAFSPHQNAIWWYGWLNEHKPLILKYLKDKLGK